jgi:S-formylglutathione hydrolase FrmB
MKTKTQQAPTCFPCGRTTGLLVILASVLVSILLLKVVAASPGPVPRGPRPEVTKIECSSLSSAILGRSVDYCVALPADYAASNARYPTLYFLHGLFENERSWSERGGQEVLDGLVSQGQVGKFLVVLPDGGKTFYVNSFDGHERYEDFFIQELVPAIDRTYRTVPDRQARGISGTSMGGYGALHLSMRHAEVFGTASAQSAALLPKFPNPIPTEGRWGFYARILQGPFGSPLNEAYWEANSPLTLAEHPEHFANLKLYFDCGDNDRYGFEEGAQLLDKILTEKGFRHEYALRPGNHGWSYLSQYMKYALLFHWHWFEQSSAAAARTGVKSGAH